MLDEFDVTILIFEKDRWTAKETFEIARKMEKRWKFGKIGDAGIC